MTWERVTPAFSLRNALLPMGVQHPLTLSLQNALLPVRVQRPQCLPPKRSIVGACARGGERGTQLEVIDWGVNLNEHSKRDGRMDDNRV
jgi:hypothetical protein